MMQFKAGRERERWLHRRLQVDIADLAALLAEEMAVVPHVRAKPGGAAIQHHLADEAALHQHAEAIVNRREGNLRHAFSRALKNLLGGGMIVTMRDCVEYLLPLPSQTQATRREALLKTLLYRGWHLRMNARP